MLCKKCGQELDKNAVICTKCGCKIKKPIFKKWWFWAIVVVVVIGIGSSAGNNNTESPVVENNTQTPVVENNTETKQPEKNSPKISKAEFEALKTGISYEEAVAIIGGEGELSSQVDVAGYETKMYIWKGEGSIGANANVTFQNGSLTSKAQFGLE